jgi:hypothetical protein
MAEPVKELLKSVAMVVPAALMGLSAGLTEGLAALLEAIDNL